MPADRRGPDLHDRPQVRRGGGRPEHRGNIVVLVDEAHRTQEGNLGLTMRAALPNALFFAFTGTPIAELDRNTFATFGDPDDEKQTLHAYTSDQSIADGMTVPIHVDPRLVTFQLDKDAVDEAFEELTDAEDLDDESGRGAGPARFARGCHLREPGPDRGGVRRHRRPLLLHDRPARDEGAGRRVRPGRLRGLPRAAHPAAGSSGTRRGIRWTRRPW